jgi:glutamate-5-semialdehyde dehydrogenase
MRCDAESREILKKAGLKGTKAATDQDFYTEYLAPVVSIAIVPGIDEAIAHIAKYGSQHTDAIVTGTGRARSGSCARWIRARSW